MLRRPRVRSPDFTLSLNNVSFRTLLNTLIRQFGIADWVVVRYGDNQEYVRIYF
jgi:hypothetical protein